MYILLCSDDTFVLLCLCHSVSLITDLLMVAGIALERENVTESAIQR